MAANQKRQGRTQSLHRVFAQLVLDRAHLLRVLLLQRPHRALRQLARLAGICVDCGGLLGQRSVGNLVELDIVERHFVGFHVGERDLQIDECAQRVGEGENVLEILRVSQDWRFHLLKYEQIRVLAFLSELRGATSDRFAHAEESYLRHTPRYAYLEENPFSCAARAPAKSREARVPRSGRTDSTGCSCSGGSDWRPNRSECG